MGDELSRAERDALRRMLAMVDGGAESPDDRQRRKHRERQRKYLATKRQKASQNDGRGDGPVTVNDGPEMSGSVTSGGESVTDRPTPEGREVGQSPSPAVTLNDAVTNDAVTNDGLVGSLVTARTDWERDLARYWICRIGREYGRNALTLFPHHVVADALHNPRERPPRADDYEPDGRRRYHDEEAF